MATLVDNEKFLKEVGNYFEQSKESGTVRLSQKRLPVAKVDDSDVPSEYQILFRVSLTESDKNSKKTAKTVKKSTKKSKCSTVVSSKDLDKFWTAYAEAIKTGMGGLMKKEKKKAKKAKKE